MGCRPPPVEERVSPDVEAMLCEYLKPAEPTGRKCKEWEEDGGM